MIHILVSSNHLTCVQWKDENSKSSLTAFSFKPFKAKKASVFSPKELLIDISAALKSVKKELSFEGEKIFVTVPDEFCDSVVSQCDDDMSEADGWEYSKWSINQRNVSTDNLTYEYFGRAFISETKTIFSIRVSSVLCESLKMSIQEMGGEPVWMGTESSAYYGLNPSRGVTVFANDKNGYSYYHYSKNCIIKGNAKFVKNKWALTSTDGSNNEKDIFKGQVVIPGKLSYRRKAHFEGKRIRQVEAFKNIKKNDIKIPYLSIITQMIFIDLFCGTGAFSHVLEKHGHTCAMANDMIKESEEIYGLNMEKGVFKLSDLNKIKVEDIPKHDILCGGFPCQPFSIAGEKKGFDDERSNVFWKIIEILKMHRPNIIILENVKNLVSHDKHNKIGRAHV